MTFVAVEIRVISVNIAAAHESRGHPVRKGFGSSSENEDDEKINLTPMLDVVFIMLIFFIVTATFVKEIGLDVYQPEDD